MDFRGEPFGPIPGLLAIAERVETYREQLETYRRAAAAILDLPPERIRASLLFLAADRLVDLEFD